MIADLGVVLVPRSQKRHSVLNFDRFCKSEDSRDIVKESLVGVDEAGGVLTCAPVQKFLS